MDRKHLSAVTVKLAVRFLLLTNELPAIYDTSSALPSRFLPLIMRESFYGREDPHLFERLRAELPQILNWALDGLDRHPQRGHFVAPASSTDAIEELGELARPLAAFVREVCEVGGGRFMSCDSLYKRYTQWCAETGHKAVAKPKLGRDLRALVPRIKSVQRNSESRRGVRYYECITIA